MRVLLVQYDIVWHDAAANFARIETSLGSAGGGFDLCILPEMFSTGFTMHPGEVDADVGEQSYAKMREWSERYDAGFCGSTVFRTDTGYANRMIFVADGESLGHYDKRHLFRPAGEADVYEPGAATPVVVEFRGWRWLLQVCYDLRFPVMAHNAESGYDAAIYIASWPEARRLHWRTLLQARAIENQAYVIGVNRVGTDGNGLRYVGDSLVVDGSGAIACDLAAAAATEVVVLDLEGLRDLRRRLPFLRDTDSFQLS